MANNRKPKLAPWSRWEGKSILDDGYNRCGAFVDKTVLYCVGSPKVTDALAAIRAAKLDPVFDSAVALAEYWDSLNGIAPISHELCVLLDANSAAVKGATSDE